MCHRVRKGGRAGSWFLGHADGACVPGPARALDSGWGLDGERAPGSIHRDESEGGTHHAFASCPHRPCKPGVSAGWDVLEEGGVEVDDRVGDGDRLLLRRQRHLTHARQMIVPLPVVERCEVSVAEQTGCLPHRGESAKEKGEWTEPASYRDRLGHVSDIERLQAHEFRTSRNRN